MIYSFDITRLLTGIFGGAYVANEFPDKTLVRKPGERTPVADGLNHNGTNGVYYMMPVSINGWQLPYEPLISIGGSKKMKITGLAGNKRRGSVKEIINTDDYNISIRGILMLEDSEDYPFDDLERLKDLYEVNQSVPIINAVTKMMGIENIVIKDIAIPEMVGKPNIQVYQINALSDEDFILMQE